jgi:uncharacterized membrane protein YhaH (DUF805 family)
MESFFIALLENYFAVLKKYIVFTGRAGRKEFWFFVLVNVVVGIIFGIFGKIPILGFLIRVAYFFFGLAILIPSIMVGIRRLHDTNLTGWLMLLCLVPVAGAIAVLVLCALEGTSGENQYGSVPSENAVM